MSPLSRPSFCLIQVLPQSCKDVVAGSAGSGQEVSQQPGAAWRLSRSLNVSLTLAAITLDPVPFHPNPILKGVQAAVDGQPAGDQMMLGACGETPPFSETNTNWKISVGFKSARGK